MIKVAPQERDSRSVEQDVDGPVPRIMDNLVILEMVVGEVVLMLTCLRVVFREAFQEGKLSFWPMRSVMCPRTTSKPCPPTT